MKSNIKDFYLMDLSNAFGNYQLVEQGKYRAYMEDAYCKDSILHIGLLYFADNNCLKAIVGKYYLSGKSRIKSLTMLLPTIAKITSSPNFRAKKKIPELSFDITDEKLVDALKLIIQSDPEVEVEMDVNYEGTYKNIRIK